MFKNSGSVYTAWRNWFRGIDSWAPYLKSFNIQALDPHQIEKSVPNLHQSENSDPDPHPHQSEERDPAPHHIDADPQHRV